MKRALSLGSVASGTLAAVALLSVTALTSAADCGAQHAAAATPAAATAAHGSTTAPGTIVDVAIAAGSFQTLVQAVQAAGLVETLKGEGPFTVFAPTDAAFAKLPKGTVEALLQDKAKLTSILTYHVVPGKLLAADVVKSKSLTTVQGQKLTVDASKGAKINGANIVKTDVLASNGVIHVIDAVVLPAAPKE